jgi:uncharacterized cupredoxin-like copper-binding protein
MMGGGKMRGMRLAVAGFLVVAAMPPAASAGTDWRRAQTVEVGLSEYEFSPGHFRFRQGTAYRLHLVNRGKELHEFAAPDFFRAVTLGNPAVLNRDRSEIQVPPGTAKSFLFVAVKPGRYQLRCPDHDWAGMVGDITIK